METQLFWKSFQAILGDLSQSSSHIQESLSFTVQSCLTP